MMGILHAISADNPKYPDNYLLFRVELIQKGILDAPVEKLSTVKEIGTVTPVALKIIRSAATLYLRQSAEGREVLSDPLQLAAFWRMRIGGLANEVFQAGYLDSSYRLMCDGVETLEEGTIDRANVYPRRLV